LPPREPLVRGSTFAPCELDAGFGGAPQAIKNTATAASTKNDLFGCTLIGVVLTEIQAPANLVGGDSSLGGFVLQINAE
jgi:hypothetical protein